MVWRRQLLAVSCLLCALPAFSFSVRDVEANASLLFIGAPGATDIASPVIVQSLGVSVPMEIAKPFYLEPLVDFYGMFYVYNGSRPEPCDIDNGTGFFTLASLISLQAVLDYPVLPSLEVGGALGIDFLLRLPAEFQNTSAATVSGSAAALSYFYSSGRFFYPETRLFVRWHAVKIMDLVFSIRALYPLFHLWDGEGQPFDDQFMMSAMVGFAFPLGAAASSGASPAASQSSGQESQAPAASAQESSAPASTDKAPSTDATPTP